MKKLVFFLLLLAVGSCKDREPASPNRADAFAGVYYTGTSKDNRSSTYIWVVTRKANNRVGIGCYIEDTFRIGNQGTASKKREVYFMENVVLAADSSFTINESVEGADKPVKLSGNGRLIRREDGGSGINVSIDFIGSDNKAVRASEAMQLSKVENSLDEDFAANDFDYAGNYGTELPEGAKTAFHNWAVASGNHANISVDYKIRDKYNQGSIGELINNYVLNETKKVGNRAISIDMTLQEEVSRDQIKVKAVGTKLRRVGGDSPSIATVVKITNETQGITRIEYLELKKQ
jgi:hypothetical protein